ncbi:hypothetical protein H0H93_009914, partial [Arthromyces matolae]
WREGQATALKDRVANLPTSGIPVWSFEDCYYEIANTQALIKFFDLQEHNELYRDEMQKHKAEIESLMQDAMDKQSQAAATLLRRLQPKIKAGGAWRNHIQQMIVEVERSHSEEKMKTLEIELLAGLRMHHEMMAFGKAAHEDKELARFYRFLCSQQRRFWKGKNAEPDPPISKSS